MDVLRSAQERDTHAGPDGFRFNRELDALLLQFGDDRVNPLDPKPNVFEAEIRGLRCLANRLLLRHLRDKYRDAAEIEVDPRPPIGLDRADYLSAEHLLVPLSGLLGVGTA